MTRVLALDLASAAGWAADAPEGGRPIYGTFTNRVQGDETGAAFRRFAEWLRGAIGIHLPDRLVYEAPLIVGGRGGTTRPTSHQTVRVLFGLAAVTEMVADERRVPCFEAHIQQVRKHFCSNGHATKDDVMRRCRLFGWTPADNNAADALAIWGYSKALSDKAFNYPRAAIFADARPA
jgi:hypothetical protein